MAKLSVRREIAKGIRERIRSGELSGGMAVPTTTALAGMFGTTVSNAHHALALLEREGLITRLPTGSRVNSMPRRLERVALCQYGDPLYGLPPFRRAIAEACREVFADDGTETEIVFDFSRENLVQRLKDGANLGRLQGAVFLTFDLDLASLAASLKIPYSVYSTAKFHNGVCGGTGECERRVFAALAARGDRRLAVLDTNPLDSDPETNAAPLEQLNAFFRAVADAGMELSPEHVLRPPTFVHHAEKFDWWVCASLEALFRRPRSAWPDVLWVQSEEWVHTVFMVLYRLKIRVPEDLRLVLQVNEQLHPIIPSSAWLIETPIRAIARTLAAQVVRQFNGEAVSWSYCEGRALVFDPESEKSSKEL